jgi:hypothetical protein
MIDLVCKEDGIVQIWVVRERILDRVMEKWSIPGDRVIHMGREDEELTLKKILADVRNDESHQAAQSRS